MIPFGPVLGVDPVFGIVVATGLAHLIGSVAGYRRPRGAPRWFS